MRTCRLIRTGVCPGLVASSVACAGASAGPRASAGSGARAGVARGNRAAQKGLRGAAGRARGASRVGRRHRRLPQLPAPSGARPPTAQVPAGAEGAAGRAARCRSTATSSAASKIFNPDMAVIGNFLGAGGKNDVQPRAGAGDARGGGVVPGDRRPVRPRRLLHRVRRGRRGARGRLHHVSDAARRAADEGRQAARGIRQGQHVPHAPAAVDRSAARHQQSGRRRGRDRRRRHLGRSPDSEPAGCFSRRRGRCSAAIRAICSRRTSGSDLSYVGHLRGYQDITESTNIDLGVSYTRGHNRSGARRRCRIPAGSRRLSSASTRPSGGGRCGGRSITRSSAARRSSGAGASSRTGGRTAPASIVSGDYQLARRWFAGVRFDQSDRADAAASRDTGGSVLLTLLAERVQPDPRPVPADELRRRPDGQRVPVPVPVLDWRARRASVLDRDRARDSRKVMSHETRESSWHSHCARRCSSWAASRSARRAS